MDGLAIGQLVQGTLAETFRAYPGIGPLLPAMGYGAEQIRDLAATIDRCDCDTVAIANRTAGYVQSGQTIGQAETMPPTATPLA